MESLNYEDIEEVYTGGTLPNARIWGTDTKGEIWHLASYIFNQTFITVSRTPSGKAVFFDDHRELVVTEDCLKHRAIEAKKTIKVFTEDYNSAMDGYTNESISY